MVAAPLALRAALARPGHEEHQAAAAVELALGGHQAGGAQAREDAGRRCVDREAAVVVRADRPGDERADPLVGTRVGRDADSRGPALELVAQLVDELLVARVDGWSPIRTVPPTVPPATPTRSASDATPPAARWAAPPS